MDRNSHNEAATSVQDGLSITILGCASSGGVPRIGGLWGDCDPSNPKNRRQRCSVLVRSKGQNGETTVLVDTSPDMRAQLLGADVRTIDAVLYTHEHADHTNGIDDLRALAINSRARVPVYFSDQTGADLKRRFSYCFQTPEGSSYPPILDPHRIDPQREIVIDGEGGALSALPIPVAHGDIDALGFRFENIAYTPDLNDIPASSVPLLEGLDVWIIDALKRTAHSTHFSLDEALEWIARLKPKRAVLTNMHIDLDYETLCNELPDNVVPAYDGMVVTAG